MSDTNNKDWQNVNAVRIIALLRERIGNLEYELAIKQAQIENLTTPTNEEQ